MGSWICCCKKGKTNPEEHQPLKPQLNPLISKKSISRSKDSFYSEIIDFMQQNDRSFEPSIEDIINQLSSGDEDDQIDSLKEEKYRQILKNIDD